MKRLFCLFCLFVLLVAIPAVAFAAPADRTKMLQRMTAKGAYSISGSISYVKETHEYESGGEWSLSQLSVNPQFGSFVAHGFMLGGGVNFISTTQSSSSYDITSDQQRFQFFGRYYFVNDGSTVAPFLGAGAELVVSESNDATLFSFTGGLCLPVIEHITIEPKFSYSIINDDYYESASLIQGIVGIGTYWY